MRIRSIRPEFWSSEDVAAMDWNTRLIFIGLWSYVDDNGVGRDVERLITTALFPLDTDLRESSRRVTGALSHLSNRGQITRYEVAGKRYFHVTAWATNQRIEKPSAGRYPPPTSDNAIPVPESPTTPVGLREGSAPGEGEKGRRGEVKTPSSTGVDAAFEAFWLAYPRKVGKTAARKAWKSAVRVNSATFIAAGLQAQLPKLLTSEERFRPHPATWLNEGRWEDEAAAPRKAAGWWDNP